MSPRRFDMIKTSLLRRVITVPRLPENALSNFGEFANSNGGVINIDIPNGTSNTKLLVANGIFNFGGIDTSSDDISITKIIIDGIAVFDYDVSGYVLNRVFSNSTGSVSDIAGNTPPYLVNESIEIYGFNSARTNGWWGGRSETLYVSLVPIE